MPMEGGQKGTSDELIFRAGFHYTLTTTGEYFLYLPLLLFYFVGLLYGA